MSDAGLSPSDIDEVILVGGSTRIPSIQEKVKEILLEIRGVKKVVPSDWLITQKFLDVNLKYLGHVNSSQRIRNSIISRTPLMSKNNKNSDTKYFDNISQALSLLDSSNTGSIKFFD